VLVKVGVLLRYLILQRSVWLPKFPYRADNSPPPTSVLSHVSPLDVLLSRFFRLPKFPYRADSSPPPTSVLSHVSPLDVLLSHFFKIPFSIILPSTSRSFLQVFSPKLCIHISLSSRLIPTR